MRKGSSVGEEKRLTEAEKQIRRLEALRSQRERTSNESVEKAFSAPKTQAERTEQKLRAMRADADRPKGRRPKIEGKQKSSKLTFLQIRVMEQLLSQDKRLRGSVVTRIALNRILGLENSGEENELEARIAEVLRNFKSRG
jgi:hypothetical protein